MAFRLPRLYKLLAPLPVSIIPGLFGYIQVAKFSAIFVALIISVKVIQLIWQRYENLKIFDRGNVPSVGCKNPIWGDSLTITCDNNIKLMLEYHRTLGKNYGMFYGPDPWLFSTDLDLLQRLFVTDADRHINMQDFRTPYKCELNRSILQMKDDEWRTERRAYNPSFSHKQVKMDAALKDIEDTCNRLIDSICKHRVATDMVSSGGNKGYIIDLEGIFKKYSLEIALRFIYGSETGANMEPYSRDEIVDAIGRSSELVTCSLAKASVTFDGLDGFLEVARKFTAIHHFMAKVHKKMAEQLRIRRKKTTKQGGGTTTLDGIKRTIDIIIERSDKRLIDDDTVKAHMFFFLVSGVETSANTLTWIFWLLAQHPEVQEKLRQALLTEGESAIYLDWVMKETLRLYPAVPAGVGRIVGEDIETSQGQTIFKGTSVLASIYSIHRSEEYWGQDVDQFRPERFAEPLRHPLQYFAFGFGPRNCIGMHLAKAEIKGIVTRILLKFRAEPCASTPNQINFASPFLTAMLLEAPVNVKLVELHQ